MSSLERLLDGVAGAKPGVVPGRDVGMGAQPGVVSGEVVPAGDSAKESEAERGLSTPSATLGRDRFEPLGVSAGSSSRGISVTFDSRAGFAMPVTGDFTKVEIDGVDRWKPEAMTSTIGSKAWGSLGGSSLMLFDPDLNLNEDKMCRKRPVEPVEPKGPMDTLSDRARAQMQQMLKVARRSSEGRRPDGRCYNHVWRYITWVGYGRMPQQEVPAGTHGRYAKQFAYYANGNLESLGLVKLPISNPYQAPEGAIVVVRAGTPGTAHPVAGDIAVAAGNGRFYNGGEMSYGGPHHFPPGNNYVLGIYVPK